MVLEQQVTGNYPSSCLWLCPLSIPHVRHVTAGWVVPVTGLLINPVLEYAAGGLDKGSHWRAATEDTNRNFIGLRTGIPLNKMSKCYSYLTEKSVSLSQRSVYWNFQGNIHNLFQDHKGKGKGHPITGHEGPEGDQMYSSTLPSTSALDGGGWSAPRPCRLSLCPQERPGTHSTGGWVGPRTGLDGCGKSLPHRDSIRGPSSP